MNLEWCIKPRGLSANVDIYSVTDERICHDVPADVASILITAHNLSVRKLEVHRRAEEQEANELSDMVEKARTSAIYT